MSPRGGKLSAGILACLCTFGSLLAADHSETAIPRGTLNVDRDLLRVGSRSQLVWEIEYPDVTGVVDIVPPNIIIPKKDLKMRVRVLGASFQQAKSNNGHGNNADGVDVSNPGKGKGGPNGAVDQSGEIDDEVRGSGSSVYLPVDVRWSKNGSSWTQIFYGIQSQIDPTELVLDTTVASGDTINFGGRGWRDGSWLPFYHTATTTNNLVLLQNGDEVPSTVPALNGSTIESFLRPYMDSSSRTVTIGERDLIILIELGQTNTHSSGFDLQDLVILVTFE